MPRAVTTMNRLLTLAITLLYFITRGFASQTPDFSHYTFPPTHTLTARHFPLDDPTRRTIVVGDIHGMYDPFLALLAKVRYDPSSDVLIHVGDITVKAPKTRSSLSVLNFMASANVTGVRGNHDQKVIEWRSWIIWVESHPAGKKWLSDLHARREEQAGDDDETVDEQEIERWINMDKKRNRSEWWDRIPRNWKILSQHYNVARRMSRREYEYLLELPIALHIPSAHAFIVHAGLLPYDPKREPSHPSQPLMRVPKLSSGEGEEVVEERLREMQEKNVLKDVPPNRDPWTVLNIRSLKQKSVSRKKRGTPWSELWNEQIDRCVGFSLSDTLSFPGVLDESQSRLVDERRGRKAKTTPLRCRPMTVVYGHAASRGLDVKRWSIGLDSGCVHGNQLTALVLGPEEQGEPAVGRRIEFGEHALGRLVSVECS